MSTRGKLYAGASGFAYDAWKPDFYPANLKSKSYLAHYATQLNAVEINYTFRRLPNASTLENWHKATPEGFVFAIKAHQRITHIQRLRPAEFTGIFFQAIDPLRVVKRLGPVLIQTPPNLKADLDLLGAFLNEIPVGVRCAFEFRNPSWLSDSTYALLERKGASLCLAESDEFVTPEVVTGGFVYCRLRKSEYSADDLRAVRERVNHLLESGQDVFVFFKHEETPAGALNAASLLAGESASVDS